MKTALVTGATGMLGSHVVEHLRDHGFQVRALVRSTAGRDVAQTLGAEPREGELTDQRSVVQAGRGCDLIVHAGGTVSAGGTWEHFHAGNVAGTSHVVEAAAEAGARLVLISSTAVYGAHRRFAEPTTEDHPLSELRPTDHYARSKLEAEQVVLAAHVSGHIWATVVRPPAMYGRRDRQFVPRLAPVLRSGFFPLIDGGGSRPSLSSAVAVAEGAVRAAHCATAGGRVFLLVNDAQVSIADLVAYAGEGLGERIRTRRLSRAGSRRLSAVLRTGLTLVGRRDLAAHVPGVFDMLSSDNPFSTARAQSELGWPPKTDPAQLLTEAFRWWAEAKAPRGGTDDRW